MDERESWKVGLITVLAVIGTVAMMAFLVPGLRAALTGGRWHFNIVIHDVQGLQGAEKVVLDGVTIGSVDSVQLITDQNDSRAREANAFLASHGQQQQQVPFAIVRVGIGQESRGRLYTYYQYQVASTSLLGTTHEVSVIPAAAPAASGDYTIKPNDFVLGTTAMGLTDLAKPAGQMMSSLSALTQKIQGLVGDPRLKDQLLASMGEVHAAATNIRLTSDQIRDLSTRANAQLSSSLPRIGQSMNNVEAATGNIRVASARVPVLMNQIQGSMGAVRGNLVAATGNVNEATGNIREASGRLRDLLNQQTVDNMHATLANFRGASDKLNSTLGNVQALTGNPRLQQDLPAILDNLRAASAELPSTVAQARTTLGTFNSVGQTANGVLGSVRGALPGHSQNKGTTHQRPAEQRVGVSTGVGILYSTRTSRNFPHRVIVDPEVALSLGANTFDIGLYDVGGQDRLSLEMLRKLFGVGSTGAALRYGLYRGKVGVGVDWILGPALGLYGTVYNPNSPSVDLEGILDVGNHYGLWGGVDEVNRNPRAVLGVRLKP